MAVVINEMEVTPQPEAAAPAPAPQQPLGGRSQQDPVKQVQKMLHVKQQRSHRLEAY